MKRIYLILCVLLSTWLFACAPASASAIPDSAWQYQRDLTRAAHYSYGLDAPVATLAGMIHQESRWRADARSPVGAQGIAQFMPATAEWMPEIYPALGEANPYDPRWAIRAAVLYTAWLHARVQASGPCERWAFTLSAYNGGLGWVYRDKRLASASGADELAWFDNVERYNSGRSNANFGENRHYPNVILTRWTPLYAHAGWGDGVCEERWL